MNFFYFESLVHVRVNPVLAVHNKKCTIFGLKDLSFTAHNIEKKNRILISVDVRQRVKNSRE